MKEISAFLTEEINVAMEKMLEIKSEIRSINLDVEFIDKACEQLSSRIDNNVDILSPAEGRHNFENEELNNLTEKRLELNSRLLSCENQLNGINLKYQKLLNLSDICNRKIKEDDLRQAKENENENTPDGSNNILDNEDILHSYRELQFQESDRSKIAIDIHDNVIQNLAALLLKNDFALRIINSDIQRAKVELNNNNNIMRECIEKLRSIVYDLRPMSFETSDFKEGVDGIVDTLTANTTMNIIYNYNIENIDKYNIDYAVVISVIRIIKELCENAIKHSNGTKIVISIDIENSMNDNNDVNNLVVRVADDGEGFDFDCKIDYNKMDFGLSMIMERVYALGGTVTVNQNECIDREKGGFKGTDFVVKVPVKEEF